MSKIARKFQLQGDMFGFDEQGNVRFVTDGIIALSAKTIRGIAQELPWAERVEAIGVQIAKLEEEREELVEKIQSHDVGNGNGVYDGRVYYSRDDEGDYYYQFGCKKLTPSSVRKLLRASHKKYRLGA